MKVGTLHHVSLPVRDLERSKRFYREVLGLEEIARPPFPFPGAWFSLGDRELHLIGGENTMPRGVEELHPSQYHFAVRVTSFREMLEGLRRQGYSEDAAADDPKRVIVSPRPVTGYPQAYICDPDRHVIEINAETLDH
jgi:catechol 2,3-dioxygenase-like lactoylglutathione lyase family enzyme